MCCQAIIFTNADLLLINKFKRNLNQNTMIFIQENAFENVVYKFCWSPGSVRRLSISSHVIGRVGSGIPCLP